MPASRLLLVCGVLATLTNPARAGEGPGKDGQGDPLPPGARARLGSTRFRVTGPVYGARFLDGGKRLLVWQAKPRWDGHFETQGELRLVDAGSGLERARLPLAVDRILGHWG